MDNLNTSYQTLERRQHSPDKSGLWSHLSISQKYSAKSLSGFGYDLVFIRENNNDSIAVLTCGESIACIDANGNIDSSPTIKIR